MSVAPKNKSLKIVRKKTTKGSKDTTTHHSENKRIYMEYIYIKMNCYDNDWLPYDGLQQ